MRRLCGETQLPDRLLGKDPSSCFANLLFLSPLPQRLSLKGTPFQGPRASQEAGRMAMPSAPLPPGPSLPKWPPGWGWTDPQVSARALPWRVLRVICPPIAGSGEHGHLRLASWPHHRGPGCRSPGACLVSLGWSLIASWGPLWAPGCTPVE